MWIVAEFLPTTLFSLRPALSTASGAQTLLVPTPFAIKMALVNAAIQVGGVAEGAQFWPVVRDLEIALKGPDWIVVNKTFIKIQRETELPKQKGVDKAAFVTRKQEEGKWPFNPTIAFREFVQYAGAVDLAVRLADPAHVARIARLFLHINYLGKRGGFWQLQAPPVAREELTSDWVTLTQPQAALATNGTLQLLDDCGAKLSWDHVNIYSGKAIKVNQDERVLRPIVLPYAHVRSSYRYSLYQRIAEDIL